METIGMVVRMRIYNTSERKIDSDRVFYELVKPVHEKYGALFLGRYIDSAGRYVVLWGYHSLDALHTIQKQVAADPSTLQAVEIRRKNGLHGVAFEEYLLESTGPIPEFYPPFAASQP